MSQLAYATVGTGPIAGGLGWMDFSRITIQPGQTITGVSGTLLDGSTITFDVTNTNLSGPSTNVFSEPENVYNLSPFGRLGYTGIVGDVVLKTAPGGNGSHRLTFSNITVRDPFGNPVTNYNIYLADGEVTQLNNNESQVWNTNGTPWEVLTILGGGPSPQLSGVGTQTATLTGVAGDFNAPVLYSTNPTQVTATLTTFGGQEAVVIGVSVTKVQLQKIITSRIDPTDQFRLNIVGNPSSNATTSGSSTGLQSATAFSYAPDGSTNFNLNEAMATGSASSLSQYTTTISYTNLTPGGTPVPTTTTLPKNLTLNLADIIVGTITNTPKAIDLLQVVKSVDKAATIPNSILTYKIKVSNTSNKDATNVVITDPIPSGTTFVLGSVTLNGGSIAGNPASGINIGTVPANSTSILTFQVKVGSTIPNPNPILNTATISYDQGSPINSNTVDTIVFDNSRGVEFI